MIITIDGPVATGKSSIAKKLAEAIGFIYFDTGAMYRALTYGIMKHHVDLNDPQALEKFLKGFQLEIKVVRRERQYFVDGENVSDIIRGETVTNAVSKVSAVKAVREKLVALQRELSEGVNAVFEGRDMGTEVFPNAYLKVFLTGRDEVRAKRRYLELTTKFPEESKNLTLERCLEEITKRDLYDSTREHSPLRQAKDAFVVDTSDLTVDEIVFKILEHKDTIKVKR